MPMDHLTFIVAAPMEDAADSKSIFKALERQPLLEKIPVKTLKKNLALVSETLMSTLADIRQVGGFKLKTVEIGVEVTAEGGIDLIGTASFGGKGAITLTFSE